MVLLKVCRTMTLNQSLTRYKKGILHQHLYRLPSSCMAAAADARLCSTALLNARHVSYMLCWKALHVYNAITFLVDNAVRGQAAVFKACPRNSLHRYLDTLPVSSQNKSDAIVFQRYTVNV